MAKSFTPLAAVLSTLATGVALQTAVATRRLGRHWATVVGPQISAHTAPERITHGVLHLRVDHPIWSHQLSFLKETLIQKSNAFWAAPMISDVRFKIGPLPPPEPEPQAAPAPPPEAPPEVQLYLERLLTAISDAALKKTILRTMIRHSQFRSPEYPAPAHHS